METERCICEVHFTWQDYKVGGGGVESQGKDMESLATTRSRRVCHAATFELCPVGKTGGHIPISILQDLSSSITRMIQRKTSLDLGDMVCRQL